MSVSASPVAGPTRLERVLRWLAWSVLVLALTLAGAYAVLRTLVWPNLDHWRPRIEQRLADATGRDVRIAALSTGFEGWRPWLVAERVVVRDADGVDALSVDRLRAVVSMRAALRGRFALALLEIDEPALRVERVAVGRLRVGGFDLALGAPGGADGLEQLFAHRRIVLRGARVAGVDRVTGRQLELADVDIVLGSLGRRHRASLHVPAWGAVADSVDAAIDFAHAPFEPPGAWRLWRGEAYLAARSADLAAAMAEWRGWADVLGLPAALDGVQLDAGRAGFRVWTRFDPDTANRTQLKLAAAGVRARADGREIPLAAVRLDAHVSHDAADRTTFVFERLEIEDERHGRFDAIAGEPMLRLGSKGEALAARLSLGHFDAARTLAWLLDFPLPPELRARLEPLRVDGQVERVALEWSIEAGDERGELDADFRGLSFSRQEDGAPRPGELRLPGFRNVSGRVRLSRGGGEAILAGEDSVLRFPGLFAEADVPLERLDAHATWSIQAASEAGAPPQVALRIESMRFANPDAAGEVSGTWRSGGGGAGIVDLTGRLERADASRTARYLPLVIPVQVRDWVREAVLAGRSDDARFVLRGDLGEFPWREPGSGTFVVEASLDDGRLSYAPGWPAIERIAGLLRFERAGMEIVARTGAVWNVALADTHARIADFANPLLRVEGAGTGPARDMIRFINESPLRTRIDDFTREISVSGGAGLRLALELPLGDLESTRVSGAVQLDGNDVVLDRGLPPFEALTGRLEFTEDRLALRELRAKFLGGSVQARGEASAPGHLRIDAKGGIPAAGLAGWNDPSFGGTLPARLVGALSGTIGFDARFELRDRVPSLSIDSDLAGVASALPAPFAKAAEERWPLRIESDTAVSGLETLRVSLHERAQLVLERERAMDGPGGTLRRGAFALGAEAALPDAGFAARVHTPQLDLDAWRALLDAEAPGAAPPGASSPAPPDAPSLLPDVVAIVSDRVHFGGKTFEDVVVGATRIEDAWQANLHARGVDGYLHWTPPAANASGGSRGGHLSARFTQLSIPTDRISEIEAMVDSAPRSLPALDIVADELVLGDRPLGALELRARNDETQRSPVWRLQHLQLRNAHGSLDATGSWRTRRGGASALSTMRFTLSVADAGNLLGLFGYRDVLRGGAGQLAGEVHWRGSPMRLDAHSLGGELSLSIGKGQFLKTEPGIAKLIGVVNLQSLRRRLVFDFRDVFAEGFAFDEITGTLKVRDGVARTDDFRIHGVTAQVAIRGEASLPAETQSLLVEVRPELNAGLASLAYAALANPAIGLGSFVAQMVLREPLQQIFAFEYDVIGPWDDPQVVRRPRPAPPVPQWPGTPGAEPMP